MPTNRPTEAEVRGLMERLRTEGFDLHHDYAAKFIALCEDWLRLMAAIELVHGPPVAASNFVPLCVAKDLLETIGKGEPDVRKEWN